MSAVLPFIYPYLHTDDDGADLRLSLRSLDSYLHLSEAPLPLVVGDAKPTWLRDECFVPSPPEVSRNPDHRLKNVALNMARGLEEAGGDSFVYMNDDFVLLEPRTDIPVLHHLERWETWMRGVHRMRLEWYRNGMLATDALIGKFPGAWAWELHCPLPMIRRPALELFSEMASREPEKVPFLRTVYGTLVEPAGTAYPAFDCLVGSEPSFGTSWVAVNGFTRKGDIERVRSRLPFPSRWEKP